MKSVSRLVLILSISTSGSAYAGGGHGGGHGGGSGGGHGGGHGPDVGDTEVFAVVGSGTEYPEDATVVGDEILVTGPATFGTVGWGPSLIRIYDRDDGHYVGAITITGEDTSQEHALSAGVVGPDGAFYTNSTQLGTIRLVKSRSTGAWTQSSYSGPFPYLGGLGPLPNGIVFGPSGEAYVPDSLQNVIWRIPAGGGTPTVWFQDWTVSSLSPELPLLINGQGMVRIGLNDIQLSPDRRRVVFSFSGGPSGTSLIDGSVLPEKKGVVYSLPIQSTVTSANLKTHYTFQSYDQPDGLAFDEDGGLMVTLAMSDQVVRLKNFSTSSTSTIDYTLDGPTTGTPFLQPSNLEYDDDGYWFLVNHALYEAATNPVDPFVVFRVYLGREGDNNSCH